MKLTALEIRKHEFGRAFRGYDAEEVDAFLNMVAQHWQTMSQDMRRLEDRLEEQTQRVNHYLKVEEAMEAALDKAKTISAERLGAAEEKAEKLVSEAEAHARKTVEDADASAAGALEAARERAAARLEEVQEASKHALKESRDRLKNIQNAALQTLTSARAELTRMEAERQQVLAGLSGYLEAGLASVREHAELTRPLDAHDLDSLQMPEVPDELARDAVEEPLPSPTDSVEEEETPEPEPVSVAEEASPEAMSEPEAESEPGAAAEPTSRREATVAEPSSDFLTDLPSADDGFEPSGSDASPTASSAEFEADDEIRKIRRILEDLDN